MRFHRKLTGGGYAFSPKTCPRITQACGNKRFTASWPFGGLWAYLRVHLAAKGR